MSDRNPRLKSYRLLCGLAAGLLASACASPPAATEADAADTASAAPAAAAESGATTRPAPEPQESTPSYEEQEAAAENGSDILNPRHPDRYVVRKGDTLWDISAMFLKDPWYWPEIWYANPQVANPHLIYPGDVLALVYRDGRPQIILERGSALRLEPRVRANPLDDAIPTIPYDRIAAFLARSRVLDRETVDQAPYILTSRRGHLVHGSATEVYVRGTEFEQDGLYSVYHVGKRLEDPDDGRFLGYVGNYVGEGRITRTGDPSTLFLSATAREALNGDKLLPIDEELPMSFTPRAPDQQIEGRIIDVLDGVSIIGAYQVVTLNRGMQDGVEPGHVLAVWQSGAEMRDRYAGGKAQLPDEYAGYLMVFRSYDRISYGLIMQAGNEIHILDKVRNP